jgi:hypothetical protein
MATAAVARVMQEISVASFDPPWPLTSSIMSLCRFRHGMDSRTENLVQANEVDWRGTRVCSALDSLWNLIRIVEGVRPSKRVRPR